MASIPRDKIDPVSDLGNPDMSTMREKRTTQIGRGFKHGLIKGTVDQVLEQIATPIADKLTPRLHELHAGLQIADPAVRSLIEFAVLNALAEIMDFGGANLAKLPGVKMDAEQAKAKTAALARWMRNYSGEKLGEELTATAAALIPMVADMMSEVDVSELLSAVENQEEEEGFSIEEIIEDTAPQYPVSTELPVAVPTVGGREGNG